MDPAARKTALRMIPYGLYVLTAASSDGRVAAATINWVTQASFEPPLVVICVKVDSDVHALIKQTGQFALNVLGKGQQKTAFTFFKPSVLEGDRISGERFTRGRTGLPQLESASAFLECKLVHTIERGDHTVMLGEVIEAVITRQSEGRPDDGTLCLKDLGERIFYGG